MEFLVKDTGMYRKWIDFSVFHWDKARIGVLALFLHKLCGDHWLVSLSPHGYEWNLGRNGWFLLKPI